MILDFSITTKSTSIGYQSLFVPGRRQLPLHTNRRRRHSLPIANHSCKPIGSSQCALPPIEVSVSPAIHTLCSCLPIVPKVVATNWNCSIVSKPSHRCHSRSALGIVQVFHLWWPNLPHHRRCSTSPLPRHWSPTLCVAPFPCHRSPTFCVAHFPRYRSPTFSVSPQSQPLPTSSPRGHLRLVVVSYPSPDLAHPRPLYFGWPQPLLTFRLG